MRRWWLGITLLLVVAAFLPVLSNDFVDFDDGVWLGRNSLIQPPTFESFVRIWHTPFLGLYVPLPMSVWHTLAHVARSETTTRQAALDPSWFHSASLICHLLATAGVGLLARRLFNQSALAGATAALWYGLHPTQVEGVAWASGLKDVMGAMLSAWSLYALTRGLQKPGPGRKTTWIWAALVIAWLAMLSKPAAVTLPASWLVIWWWTGRPRPRAAHLAALTLLIGGSITMAVVTRHVQNVDAMTMRPTVPQKLMIVGDSLGHYIAKSAVPVDLCMDYGRSPRWVTSDGRWVPRAALAVVTVLIAAGAALAGRATGFNLGPRFAMGVMLAVIPITPVLGYVPFIFQEESTVTDHYQMQFHLGAGLAVAAGILMLTRWRPRLSRTNHLGVAAVALVYVLMTYRQVGTWHDSQTLFAHATRVSPNPAIAINNLAVTSTELPSATRLEMYRTAIRNRPTYADPYGNISQIMLDLGNLPAALEAGAKAVELEPLSADHRRIYAEALIVAGRREDAMRELQTVLTSSPNDRKAKRLLERATTMPTMR